MSVTRCDSLRIWPLRRALHDLSVAVVRQGEIRRPALAVRAGRDALAADRAQLQTIVDEMAPALTERRGVGATIPLQPRPLPAPYPESHRGHPDTGVNSMTEPPIKF